MRKVLFVVFCLLLAIFIFVIVLYLLSQRPQKGALQVTSSPNAKVYINGKLAGQTPLCECQPKDMLNEGIYTVQLIPVSGNYEPFQTKVTITSKVLTVVDRTFAQAPLAQASIISLIPIENKNDAQISIVSFPSDASIFLDSNLEGNSPLLLKNITESDHEIKVIKDGYKDKIVRIKTVLGYKLEIVIYLGIDTEIATKSATLISSPAASLTTKVLILSTPTGFLRVRDSASLGGKEIGQVKPGEAYDLVSEQTNWYQIKLKTGVNGWISSQYAKKQ